MARNTMSICVHLMFVSSRLSPHPVPSMQWDNIGQPGAGWQGWKPSCVLNHNYLCTIDSSRLHYLIISLSSKCQQSHIPHSTKLLHCYLFLHLIHIIPRIFFVDFFSNIRQLTALHWLHRTCENIRVFHHNTFYHYL